MGGAEGVGGEGEQQGEPEGDNKADDAKETKAAQSCVSFSSEKETKEPWHPSLLSLGDDTMDPDPEGGVGGEG